MTPEQRAKIESIAKNNNLIDCLFLVSKGVPFDVAFSLDDEARFAWSIILGELGGGKFNWSTMQWERND